MDHMKFTRRYLILNEVLNAVTHGIGFGLSIAGLVILLIKGARLDSPIHIISYAIYGSMMILLFLFSTLFHSLMFTRAKKFSKSLITPRFFYWSQAVIRRFAC